jgi:hypothetical protein
MNSSEPFPFYRIEVQSNCLEFMSHVTSPEKIMIPV